jgi:hypothetical protein
MIELRKKMPKPYTYINYEPYDFACHDYDSKFFTGFVLFGCLAFGFMLALIAILIKEPKLFEVIIVGGSFLVTGLLTRHFAIKYEADCIHPDVKYLMTMMSKKNALEVYTRLRNKYVIKDLREVIMEPEVTDIISEVLYDK